MGKLYSLTGFELSFPDCSAWTTEFMSLFFFSLFPFFPVLVKRPQLLISQLELYFAYHSNQHIFVSMETKPLLSHTIEIF